MSTQITKRPLDYENQERSGRLSPNSPSPGGIDESSDQLYVGSNDTGRQIQDGKTISLWEQCGDGRRGASCSWRRGWHGRRGMQFSISKRNVSFNNTNYRHKDKEHPVGSGWHWTRVVWVHPRQPLHQGRRIICLSTELLQEPEAGI